MLTLLLQAWTLPEWRHHGWRQALALLAVALGVALAFAVHLINTSALDEFSSAVRQVNAQADFELRGPRDGFDEALYARVAAHPQVRLASPVIEVDTYAYDAAGARVPLRVVGLDAMVAGLLAPALVPELDAASHTTNRDRARAMFDPDALFLNTAARERLGRPAQVTLQQGAGTFTLPVRGHVTVGGAPLAVLDIAGAQARFGLLGRLSRLDVRLAPGADRARVVADLALPPGVRAATPDEAAQRVSNLSRAYRINMTVLALVALFTGGFLVFSVLSLSVAQRLPQLALMGVLGLSARQRLTLVIGDAAVLGAAGSVLGLALGTALAQAALWGLAGDLGGGYFPGVTPRLQWSAPAALVIGLLGLVAALAGAWAPARAAQRLAPAQALKGLGSADGGATSAWTRALGPLLLLAGAGLAALPAIDGLPLAAYASVALLLLGGIACVPALTAVLLGHAPAPRNAALLIALERVRDQRQIATIAVAGVVASLALSVALTVMVASFRDAVANWLDQILPADLYVRTAARSDAAAQAYLPSEFLAAAAAVPGVARVEGQRVALVTLDPANPPVALIARPLDVPEQRLPLLGALEPAPTAGVGIYVSEAVETLYGARPGEHFELPLPDGRRIDTVVRGVWRDYARQHGAVAIDRQAYIELTGDARVNDLALWLAPGTDAAAVQAALRQLAALPSMLEFATTRELRATSLRIFDRSFVVTRWLQVVAIGIGLAGVAASFSAQVLARRREFGLLAHLGFTRRQILTVVAGEGALWTGVGALLGLVLGIAVSAVLVHVVNPQSFHWTMELRVPVGRLLALAGAVLAAGTITATLAARRAAGRDMALAVKEDW